MPRASLRARLCALATCVLASLSVNVTAQAAPDGVDPSASSAQPHAPTRPTFRFEAAGGVGWARDSSSLTYRELNEARAAVSYLETKGLVLELHGVFQRSFRSYAPSVAAAAGSPPPIVAENRVAVGVSVGWDPLDTWVARAGRSAGLLLVVTRADVNQFMNPVAPIVGFEPGGGFRTYVRIVRPLTFQAGASYQWVTNLSAQASTARVVRGGPLGTLRYDAGLALELTHFALVDVRYAGESFDFQHEHTLVHSLLLGVTLDV